MKRHLCACSSSAAKAFSWLHCCLTFSVLCLRRAARPSSPFSWTMSSVVFGLPSSVESGLLWNEQINKIRNLVHLESKLKEQERLLLILLLSLLLLLQYCWNVLKILIPIPLNKVIFYKHKSNVILIDGDSSRILFYYLFLTHNAVLCLDLRQKVVNDEAECRLSQDTYLRLNAQFSK